MCGIGEVDGEFDTCNICGWQKDTTQEQNPDYVGGVNNMTFNQYKIFWNENKKYLLSNINDFFNFYFSFDYYEKLTTGRRGVSSAPEAAKSQGALIYFRKERFSCSL